MMNADEMTGYPSIDKPWLKYYSKEFINKPLKKCTVYQNVYTSNSEHMSDIALIYFNNKISYRTLAEILFLFAQQKLLNPYTFF